MGGLNTPNPGGSGGFAGGSSGAGGGGDYGPSQMAGSSPMADAGMTGGDPDAQSNALSAVTQQFMQITQLLQGLAQQFPAAAEELREADQACQDALKRIVSSPSDQDQAVPRSMA